MANNIFKIIGFMALLVIRPVFAVDPENGWWWNPSQAGVGYNLEVQNNTVFVAVFIYDNNGNPTWYSGSGNINQNLNQNNDNVTINLQQSTGGPCLGCTYTAPQTSTTDKQLALTFDQSGSTGTAVLDGVTTQIKRFNFNLGSGAQKLVGAWTIVSLPVASASGQAATGAGTSNYIVCSSVSDQGVVSCTDAANNPITFSSNGSTSFPSYQGVIPTSGGESIAYLLRFQGLNHLVGVSAMVDPNASVDEVGNVLKNSTNLALARGFRDESATSSAPAFTTNPQPSQDNNNGSTGTINGFTSNADAALSKAFQDANQF
ncbi:hypothetical conserved protein [Candidatus Nitrosoglobus terrae]|uniref:Hypothetical conserved protein n=1 Tax=Candidatus Nitrosoglobus terrae TaxID=1630141 RepID=A0A1Q2SMJ5_9GAMM|nr:hypothetical protein [Candidatus Nitrosoglobus terrae]BAW80342.1 hypothetical conserved protein [Candidatus Nitrosoglobus terrae]